MEKAWVEYEWDGASYEDPSMLYERASGASAGGAYATKVDFPSGAVTSHVTAACTEDMVEWLTHMTEHNVAVRVMAIPYVEAPEDQIEVKSGTKVALLPPLPPPRQLKKEVASAKEEIVALKKAHAATLAAQSTASKAELAKQDAAAKTEVARLEEELEAAKKKCQCSVQ